MNAGLQVVLHTPNISNYFLNKFEGIVSKYYCEGLTVSKEFRRLVDGVWRPRAIHIRPDEFKQNVKECISLLKDSDQHDSFEFISELLSNMDKEIVKIKELNTTKKKRNCVCSKKIDIHENSSERSIISECIQGLNKRVLKCSGCGFTEYEEDPFYSLTLNIPSKDDSFKLIVKLVNMKNCAVENYEFKVYDISKEITYVLHYINRVSKKNTEYKLFFISDSTGEPIEINEDITFEQIQEYTELKDQATVVIYELEKNKGNIYYDFELLKEVSDDEISFSFPFKSPIKDDNYLDDIYETVYDAFILENKIETFETSFWSKLNPWSKSAIKYENARKLFSIRLKSQDNLEKSKTMKKVNRMIMGGNFKGYLLKKLRKDYGIYNPTFEIVILSEKFTFYEIKFTGPPQTIGYKSRKEADCSIYDCFDQFVSQEIYENNECRECGKTTNSIQMSKIFNTPKYLILYLLRFDKNEYYNESFSRSNYHSKKENYVNYPINGLDISKYCADEVSKEDTIYDLYGVIHHSGSTSYRHYWATIKNDINSDNWYCFNDERVTKCDESDIVNKTGYVLFYTKRGTNNHEYEE